MEESTGTLSVEECGRPWLGPPCHQSQGSVPWDGQVWQTLGARVAALP